MDEPPLFPAHLLQREHVQLPRPVAQQQLELDPWSRRVVFPLPVVAIDPERHGGAGLRHGNRARGKDADLTLHGRAAIDQPCDARVPDPLALRLEEVRFGTVARLHRPPLQRVETDQRRVRPRTPRSHDLVRTLPRCLARGERLRWLLHHRLTAQQVCTDCEDKHDRTAGTCSTHGALRVRGGLSSKTLTATRARISSTSKAVRTASRTERPST